MQQLLEAIKVGDYSKVLSLLLELPQQQQANLGENVLTLAVKYGYANIVKLLLEYKVKLKISDENIDTAWLAAVNVGKINSLEVLLNYQADINAQDKEGKTALILAACDGQASIVNFLLERGADTELKDKDKRTAEEYAKAKAKADDSYEKIIAYFALHRAKTLDSSHEKAIIEAIDANNLDAIKQIITPQNCHTIAPLKIDPDEILDTIPPLHYACKKGRTQIVKYFVDICKIDINQRDLSKRTPLMCAAIENQSDVINTLFSSSQGKTININAQNKNDKTALYFAVAKNAIEAVKILVANKANVDYKDKDGKTALHKAAENGYIECTEILIINNANINAKTLRGSTPLMRASASGNKQAVETLLKYKDSRHLNINEKNNNDWIALHDAVDIGNLEIIKLLLDNGADINAKNSESTTPLMLAAINGHAGVVKMLLDYKAHLKINDQDNENETALHHAAQAGNNNIIEMLLANGANIHAKNKKGTTPLMLASAVSNTQSVAFFLKYKDSHQLNINEKNKHDWTALHDAARKGKIDCIKILLDNGANILAKNQNGSTPIMIAIINNKMEAFLYLLMSHPDALDTVDRDKIKQWDKEGKIDKSILKELNSMLHTKDIYDNKHSSVNVNILSAEQLKKYCQQNGIPNHLVGPNKDKKLEDVIKKVLSWKKPIDDLLNKIIALLKDKVYPVPSAEDFLQKTSSNINLKFHLSALLRTDKKLADELFSDAFICTQVDRKILQSLKIELNNLEPVNNNNNNNPEAPGQPIAQLWFRANPPSRFEQILSELESLKRKSGPLVLMHIEYQKRKKQDNQAKLNAKELKEVQEKILEAEREKEKEEQKNIKSTDRKRKNGEFEIEPFDNMLKRIKPNN